MIHVCPLHHVGRIVQRYGVKHVVTLISDEKDVPYVQGIDPGQHLKLCFNDVIIPCAGLTVPSLCHVQQLIDFIVRWDSANPILFHCWAGLSRSTAAAFIALCTLNPHTDETVIAAALRTASPISTPNKLIIAHGDAILKRKGRMIKAINTINVGETASMGYPFQMPDTFQPYTTENFKE